MMQSNNQPGETEMKQDCEYRFVHIYNKDTNEFSYGQWTSGTPDIIALRYQQKEEYVIGIPTWIERRTSIMR